MPSMTLRYDEDTAKLIEELQQAMKATSKGEVIRRALEYIDMVREEEAHGNVTVFSRPDLTPQTRAASPFPGLRSRGK